MTKRISPLRRIAVAVGSAALGAGLLPGISTATAEEPINTEAVTPATSPAPFTCQPKLYQAASASGKYLFEYTLNGTTGFSFEKVGPDNGGLNGMGYNTADHYIYGNNGSQLIRLGSDGVVEVLPQQPTSLSGHNSGDFWGPNILISAPGTNNNWKRIDLTNPDNPQVSDFTLDGGGTTTYRGSDIAILGNTAYAIHDSGTGLFVIDLVQQTIRLKSLSGLNNHIGTGYGAAFADAQGNLFFHNNGGYIWRIWADKLALDAVPIEKVGSIPKYGVSTLSAPNDGASCADAQSPYSAIITSEASSSISASSATLTASVDPQNLSTTATACYSTSSTTSGGAIQGCTDSSQAANASTINPLMGTSGVPLDPITLSGLAARTTYYWQIKTVSDYATTYGAVQSFTTTGAPVAKTLAASGVSTTAVTLNGLVNPGNRSTTVDFCYGTTVDLTSCTSASATQSPISGTVDAPVSLALTGLPPGSRYYAQVRATNEDGSASGSIVSFTTLDVPSITLGSTSDVTSTDARLNASVDPKGLSTSVQFCFGTAADLTGCTMVTATESPLVAVNTSVDVTVDLTALSPSTMYYVRVSATNSNGSANSSIGSFMTSARPLVLTTTTGSLTTGTVGTVYSRALSADGGTAPYTWGVVGGSLPSGLSLNATTGIISGTPLFDGGSSFTIEVTDATSQTATKVFSISVVDSPDAITTAATSVGTTTVVVNGSVDPGNLVTASSFCFGTASDLTGCTEVAADQSPLAAGPSSASVSKELTGLTPGTTYYARVQAVNSTGPDAGNIVSFTTTSAPDASTVSAIFRDTAGQAILTGSIDPGGLSTNVSFCLGATPTLVGCTSVAADQSPLSASHESEIVSKEVTGLTQGATYYFNVTATNSAGTDVGSTIEFTMPLIDAPSPTISVVSPISGDAVGGTTLTITGTNFSSVGSGPTVSVGGVAATVTAFTPTSLTVTTPTGDPGMVDVIVFNLDGQAVRATNAFTYTSATTYSITYNANGATSGSAPIDTTAYHYNDPATVEGAGTLERNGYEFADWNTSAVGVGTAYSAGATPAITTDLSLYAQWRAVADLGTSAASLSFGTQAVGSGSHTTRTVAVTNSGAAIVSVSSPGITITGTDAGDFSVSGGTCTDGGSITAFASCTIEVAFDPQASGSRIATLSIATSDGTQTVILVGSGTGSAPTPAPNPTPFPVVVSDPPMEVSATAGDASVNVSWRSPVSSGSFPVSNYLMQATPGGASCLVPESQFSCVISGLTNGVTYIITGRALTGAGWSSDSAPSAPVTPTGSPAPDPGPTPEPLPKPDPVPGPVPPGTVKVTIDGELDPQATSSPGADDAVVIVSGDYSVDASALDSSGRPLPLGEGNQLQPMAKQRVSIAGEGFYPSTYAAVYVHDPEDEKPVLGEPVIIGAVLVDDSGLFTGSWALPARVIAGEYVLQVVGTTSRLEALSANMSMTVTSSQVRSITISSQRSVTRAKAEQIRVYGRTEGLDGQVVQARVRYPGQRPYFSGSTRIVSEGKFTWQRLTNKRVYVYFQAVSEDGQKTRSNRLAISPVGR